MSLFEKAAQGAKWTFIENFSNLFFQFAVGVVLARLLSPQEFGIVALCYIFVELSRGLLDSGLNHALIQKKHLGEYDLPTVFWYNTVLGLVLFMIVQLSTNVLAVQFNQPEIRLILPVLSFIILLEGIILTKRAYLIRTLQFNTLALINLTAKTTSSLVAIYMAYRGFSYWSLVVREVGFVALQAVLYGFVRGLPWVYGWKSFQHSAFKPLWAYGWRIFVADQLEHIGNQITQILIGKRYTVAALGHFQKAEQFQYVFSQTLVSSVNKVMFPALSPLQDEPERLREGYARIVLALLSVIVPVLGIAFLTAPIFIPGLLGASWKETVPLFQILCVGAVAYPFTVINLNMLKVRGMSRAYLRICLVSKGSLVPFVLVGLQFGIIGLVLSVAVHRVFAVFVNSILSHKAARYSIWAQFYTLRYIFLAGCVSFATAALVAYVYPDISQVIKFFAISGSFAGIYGCILYLLDRSSLLLLKATFTSALRKR